MGKECIVEEKMLKLKDALVIRDNLVTIPGLSDD